MMQSEPKHWRAVSQDREIQKGNDNIGRYSLGRLEFSALRSCPDTSIG
jgi:hypothetical protein